MYAPWDMNGRFQRLFYDWIELQDMFVHKLCELGVVVS